MLQLCQLMDLSKSQRYDCLQCINVNNLMKGDADLRFYITTVQDG